MASTAAHDAWASALQRLHAEAGGVIAVAAVRSVDMPEIIVHALSGDADALRMLKATTHALRQIDTAPRGAATLCGCCPRRLRRGEFSIAIAVPARDDPTEIMTLGVCTRCATSSEEITAKAIIAFKQIWPDLRQVTVTHPEGGHA